MCPDLSSQKKNDLKSSNVSSSSSSSSSYSNASSSLDPPLNLPNTSLGPAGGDDHQAKSEALLGADPSRTFFDPLYHLPPESREEPKDKTSSLVLT